MCVSLIWIKPLGRMWHNIFKWLVIYLLIKLALYLFKGESFFEFIKRNYTIALPIILVKQINYKLYIHYAIHCSIRTRAQYAINMPRGRAYEISAIVTNNQAGFEFYLSYLIFKISYTQDLLLRTGLVNTYIVTAKDPISVDPLRFSSRWGCFCLYVRAYVSASIPTHSTS